MVERELEYARKAIIAGKLPLKIKKYRRSRLFWSILAWFAAILFCLNFSGILPWIFWVGAIPLLPALLALCWFRRDVSRAPEHDLGIIVAALAIMVLMTARGLAYAGLPAADYFPACMRDLTRVIL
ncbi:MAG: hypothetical protein MUD10_05645 [Candidatus Pacebacteria bacterium]|jgi:hypothetical protein|nr:hypothetical protein [Candidatus Paceibacterota bacterium]